MCKTGVDCINNLLFSTLLSLFHMIGGSFDTEAGEWVDGKKNK